MPSPITSGPAQGSCRNGQPVREWKRAGTTSRPLEAAIGEPTVTMLRAFDFSTGVGFEVAEERREGSGWEGERAPGRNL